MLENQVKQLRKERDLAVKKLGEKIIEVDRLREEIERLKERCD